MNELWELYLAEKQSMGRSPYTLEKARWAWRKWPYHDVAPHELRRDQVVQWHGSLFKEGLQQNTVSTHARVLHNFLMWCRNRGYIEFDPPPAPGPARSDPETLTLAQARAFLGALTIGRNHLRNRAVGLLLLSTGLRLGEIAQLTLEDIQEGMVRVRGRTSKSRRTRVVPLGQTAAAALREYIVWGRQGSQVPQLFLAEDGTPLGRNGLYILVKRAGRRAGLKSVYPHLLRHTFATQALLTGSSAFHIKSLLGHASIRSTEVYVDMAAVQASLTDKYLSPIDLARMGQYLRTLRS